MVKNNRSHGACEEHKQAKVARSQTEAYQGFINIVCLQATRGARVTDLTLQQMDVENESRAADETRLACVGEDDMVGSPPPRYPVGDLPAKMTAGISGSIRRQLQGRL
jgi:hypothetical protein